MIESIFLGWDEVSTEFVQVSTVLRTEYWVLRCTEFARIFLSLKNFHFQLFLLLYWTSSLTFFYSGALVHSFIFTIFSIFFIFITKFFLLENFFIAWKNFYCLKSIADFFFWFFVQKFFPKVQNLLLRAALCSNCCKKANFQKIFTITQKIFISKFFVVVSVFFLKFSTFLRILKNLQISVFFS